MMQEKAFCRRRGDFREDDTLNALHVITEGQVRISKLVPGIGEEALAILHTGTYFGEMELVDPEKPSAARRRPRELRVVCFSGGRLSNDAQHR
ncbi:MAG: cyclic nucleotide-binding domain-containing protein [Myxococcota bacterium]